MEEDGDIIDLTPDQDGIWSYQPDGGGGKTVETSDISAKERWERAQAREAQQAERSANTFLESARQKGRELSWWINSPEGRVKAKATEDDTAALVNILYEDRISKISRVAERLHPGDREAKRDYVAKEKEKIEQKKRDKAQKKMNGARLNNLEEHSYLATIDPDYNPRLTRTEQQTRTLRQFETDRKQLATARRYQEELEKPAGERDVPISLSQVELRMAGLAAEQVKEEFAKGWSDATNNGEN